MATKKATGRFRLSAAALADASDERHSKSFGPSRKGLFYRLPMSDGRVLIMPSIQRRGAKGEPLPYYAIGQHWVDVPDDSEQGQHREGKTCWSYLRDEQPVHFEQLEKESQYSQDDMCCFFCELLDTLRDDEAGDWVGLPKQTMKIKGRVIETDRPLFSMDKAFNIPVLMPEDCYDDDDDHPIKIFPAKITVIKSLMDQLQKYYPDLLDPELNQWADIALTGKSYSVQVLPPGLVKSEKLKLWVPDWEQAIPDLEDLSPNFSTYEEQRELVQQVYPNIYEVYEARKGDATVKKVAPKSRTRKTTKAATTKTSAKKTTTRTRRSAKS